MKKSTLLIICISLIGLAAITTVGCLFVFRGNKECQHQYEVSIITYATCETEGEQTLTCTLCGNAYAEIIAPTGHVEVTDKAIEATCTEDGKSEGKHCSLCNKVLVAQKVIKATGHVEVTDKAVKATCTEDGKSEGKHCSLCNKVLVAQKVIKATGHVEVTDKAVKATCTEDGKSEGKHCSVCNKVLVAQKVVKATGHVEVTDKAVKATCTEDGKSEGKHCSVCNKVLVAQKVVKATGHVEVTDKAVKATCTEDGKSEGKHCSVCNKVLVAQKVIKATGHQGQYTCSYCGKRFFDLLKEKIHTHGPYYRIYDSYEGVISYDADNDEIEIEFSRKDYSSRRTEYSFVAVLEDDNMIQWAYAKQYEVYTMINGSYYLEGVNTDFMLGTIERSSVNSSTARLDYKYSTFSTAYILVSGGGYTTETYIVQLDAAKLLQYSIDFLEYILEDDMSLYNLGFSNY